MPGPYSQHTGKPNDLLNHVVVPPYNHVVKRGMMTTMVKREKQITNSQKLLIGSS